MRYEIAGGTAAAIAASIESAIHEGALRPDTALPTIRELAAQLRVSPVTVASAYRQLHSRGLLASQGRRGTRVRGTAPASVHLTVAPAEMSAGLIDLASGSPDPTLLPPLDQALRSVTAARVYGASPLFRPLASFAAAEFSADGVPSTS